MSSINTNMGAMVALDTLKGINKNLGQVQSEISTGRSINSAADNAAIWSISTVMETDVAGFEQISNSLNLGSATVGVARTAAEEVVSELQSIRDNVIAAQESNVDRDKIQADIAESVKQIGSVVNSAQFNGQNLLNEAGSVSVLSSLDRGSDGSVSASKITVNKVNLSTAGAVSASPAVTAGATQTGKATFASSGLDGSSSAITATTAITVDDTSEAGNTTYAFTVGSTAVTYDSTAGQTADQIATGIKAAIDAESISGLTVTIANGNEVQFAGNADFSISSATTTATNAVDAVDAAAAGGLNALTTIDVTDDAGATAALTAINTMLDTAIDAAASFGSKEKRIDSQIDFVSSLSDSLESGVSTLVDANLEEASARLQALQVQQQLGVQALSIANQAPQALLSLFR
ncbi:MAG: flagellin [Litorimonas sp.]